MCSWLPCLADWQVSCYRYVVQLQQNICHQKTLNTSNGALSPWRGPEGASRIFWGETNIVSQIGRYFAWQHLVYQAGNLELNSSCEMAPFGRSYTNSYSSFIVTTVITCIVSEKKLDIRRKLRLFSYALLRNNPLPWAKLLANIFKLFSQPNQIPGLPRGVTDTAKRPLFTKSSRQTDRQTDEKAISIAER